MGSSAGLVFKRSLIARGLLLLTTQQLISLLLRSVQVFNVKSFCVFLDVLPQVLQFIEHVDAPSSVEARGFKDPNILRLEVRGGDLPFGELRPSLLLGGVESLELGVDCLQDVLDHVGVSQQRLLAPACLLYLLLDKGEVLDEPVQIVGVVHRVDFNDEGEGHVLEDILLLGFAPGEQVLEHLVLGGEAVVVLKVVHQLPGPVRVHHVELDALGDRVPLEAEQSVEVVGLLPPLLPQLQAPPDHARVVPRAHDVLILERGLSVSK